MDINLVYHNLANSQPNLLKLQFQEQLKNIISLCKQSDLLLENNHPEHLIGILKIKFQEFTNFIVLVEYVQKKDDNISYDHRDIRVIWLVNPETEKPIELELTYDRGYWNQFGIYNWKEFKLQIMKKVN